MVSPSAGAVVPGAGAPSDDLSLLGVMVVILGAFVALFRVMMLMLGVVAITAVMMLVLRVVSVRAVMVLVCGIVAVVSVMMLVLARVRVLAVMVLVVALVRTGAGASAERERAEHDDEGPMRAGEY